MGIDGKDPVVRYAALGILCVAVVGALAVAVHGYWSVPNYQPPGLVAALLGSAVTTAAHILGIQQGSDKTQAGIEQGARVAQNGSAVHVDKAA